MPLNSLEAVELLCEYSRNPLGIDSSFPRFSWIVNSNRRNTKQTAFQILVADSEGRLSTDQGNVWDSGKVLSDKSFSIEYAGNPLISRMRYFWKVRIWDERGTASNYSNTCWWEMGLLRSEDWKAKWIEGGKLFRRAIALNGTPEKARAYVTCVGYYELRINGRKVGDRVLDPAPSAHDKRLYYATYDIGDFLSTRDNIVHLFLGRARQDRSAFLLQLELTSDSDSAILVGTDESWECCSGPIIYDDLYDGEKYDSRLNEINSELPWCKAKLARDLQSGTLTSSATFPPIRVAQSTRAISIAEPLPHTFVFDFGQNFSGWVQLSASGPAGSEVTLRYSELLNDNGTINPGTNRVAKATDVFVLNGAASDQCFEPRFTYHGFRYVELTGFSGVPTIDTLVGKFVHSDVETVGSFASSNDLLNSIHRMTVWTQLSNLMGVPTDSPQRDERLGWLQDAMLSAEEAMMNFGMCGFLEKFLRDIADSQKDDGSIPDVVPSRGQRYPADSSCGATYIKIAYLLYLFYGDARALEEHYEGMKSWVEYEASKAQNYILNLSKYGDWCAPSHVKPVETPGELISTFWFHQNCTTLSQIALILGKNEEAKRLLSLSARIKDAFNSNFLREREDREYAHAENYRFFGYGLTQTSNILPLWSGMVPENKVQQVLAGLVQDVETTHDGHLNTGIIGTRFFFHTLSKYGFSELAYRVATKRSYPSYGYMLQEGATTLWERWEYLTGGAMNSHNHIMFGSIDGWFYDTLGGIYPDLPGFKHFRIQPFIPKKLESTSISVRTLAGLISSSWKKGQGASEFSLDVSVPPNASARIFLPKTSLQPAVVSEGGNTIFNGGEIIQKLPEGISSLAESTNYLECEVGSGNYSFKITTVD